MLTLFFVWLKVEDTNETTRMVARMTQLAEERWKGDQKNKGQSPLLVDVRSHGEFVASHCKGAINIPYEKLKEEFFLLALNRNTPLFLYSRSVKTSNKAVEFLKGIGYEFVFNLNEIEEHEALRKR